MKPKSCSLILLPAFSFIAVLQWGIKWHYYHVCLFHWSSKMIYHLWYFQVLASVEKKWKYVTCGLLVALRVVDKPLELIPKMQEIIVESSLYLTADLMDMCSCSYLNLVLLINLASQVYQLKQWVSDCEMIGTIISVSTKQHKFLKLIFNLTSYQNFCCLLDFNMLKLLKLMLIYFKQMDGKS